MRIAVINEDSQADKHELICSTLADVVSQYGHDVISLGMVNENDQHEINFTEIGVLASVLIECGIADFVATGCGTGQGAMMSCNSFPNLYCGYVNQPLDAYLFAQVNAGNCISMPFAQYFGWGAEINLRYVFERLFEREFGQGYPDIYAKGEARSRANFMNNIKGKISKSTIAALKGLDQEYLKSILDYTEFKENYKKFSSDCELSAYIKELLKL